VLLLKCVLITFCILRHNTIGGALMITKYVSSSYAILDSVMFLSGLFIAHGSNQ
jgi:hypothetical protein